MLGVTNRVCIVLCLCSALLACNRGNTEAPEKREETDPVKLLRTLPAATGFDRALILERLHLTKESIRAWNDAAKQNPERTKEAREHIELLQAFPDPIKEWSPEKINRALERHAEIALTKIVRTFPDDAAQYFDRLVLTDRERARLLAKVLAAMGERYPQAVISALDRPKDQAASDEGFIAIRNRDYERAATLLDRAGNPFALTVRYYDAVQRPSLPVIERALSQLKPEYREMSWRLRTYRANLLEFEDQYLQAHADYNEVIAAANGDPTCIAAARARKSFNFAAIGNTGEAFREAQRALEQLPRVANIDARNHAYSSAANAAAQLGYPQIALLYQNAGVEDLQRVVSAAPAERWPKVELSVALRQRAEILAQLGEDAGVQDDLQRGADLAEAAQDNEKRDLLRMRRLEVQGQMLLKNSPAEAAKVFSEVIELANGQDSTYRAILHFERGLARRKANDPRGAGEDDAAAIGILRNEVRRALTINPQVATEFLWTPYFSRFRDWQDELIESRILAHDFEGALVYDELARAFEPMQILLQSRSPGFRFIETPADLQKARANLPEDTVVLQYLVLPEKTFTWVITRERVKIFQSSATKADVQKWVAADSRRAAYVQLFEKPLESVPAKTRIVIVPDESMQGLAFNALENTKGQYLIERGSVAVHSSTSLYLYALARDRQLSAGRNPTVLLLAIPDPKVDGYDPIPYAKEEVEELSRHYYPGAAMLVDAAATVQGFLAGAKNAAIIHFAGHAHSVPENPWQSPLLLSPRGQESGVLTAQKLLLRLPDLTHTRLVVLSACETFSGGSVGDHGLTPLARPFVAANVPAVVGSLWDVNDASTKELMVLLHCHYRHGDDVAVALRNAQLEMLRKKVKGRPEAWKAFQVVGFAASPYPRSAALEDTSSEHVCTQNSLLGPDGLHPQ